MGAANTKSIDQTNGTSEAQKQPTTSRTNGDVHAGRTESHNLREVDSQNESDKMRLRMLQVKERVQDTEEIVRYLELKVQAHCFERKFDKVILAGGLSNTFYLPQKLPNTNSYVVEMAVLYERPLQNVHVPIYLEQMVSEVPSISLSVTEPPNAGSEPSSVVWLQVLETRGNTMNYQDRFEHDDGGNTYLQSWQYRTFIPGEYDYGIIGEKEIHANISSVPPKQYRTFKADELAISMDGKELKFSCFIDKVAAIRVPWPEIARDFRIRGAEWPSVSVVEEIVSSGCHVIPKIWSGALNTRDWVYDFSTAVLRLETEFSESQKAVYLLLELLNRNHLDLAAASRSSGEASGLKAYHLKMAMFWTCCELSKQIWHDDPVEALKTVLRKLLLFLRQNNCPDFFIPTLNLFKDLWGQQERTKPLLEWLKKNTTRATVIAKLELILANLGAYLTANLVDTFELKTANEKEQETSPATESSKEVKALRFLGDLVQSAFDKSVE